MSLFALSEFIEMAARDEDTGAAFYKAFAGKTKNQSLRTALLSIAAQEEKHAAAFRAMQKEVSKAKIREEYAGQYESYLRALLDSRAFTSEEKAVSAVQNYSTDLEAIEAALRMEKDTLLFYREMTEFLPTATNSIIKKIMDEEKQHLHDLQALKA